MSLCVTQKDRAFLLHLCGARAAWLLRCSLRLTEAALTEAREWKGGRG